VLKDTGGENIGGSQVGCGGTRETPSKSKGRGGKNSLTERRRSGKRASKGHTRRSLRCLVKDRRITTSEGGGGGVARVSGVTILSDGNRYNERTCSQGRRGVQKKATSIDRAALEAEITTGPDHRRLENQGGKPASGRTNPHWNGLACQGLLTRKPRQW